MNLYTTYFARVKDLPPNIVPVAIAVFPPRGWEGYTFRPLAPDATILHRYRGDGDWEAYAKSYNAMLSRYKPEAVVGYLHTIAHGQDVALVCFEKDPATCHRSLVAEWLTHAGYPCKEFQF